jgi:hypothetical protein
MRLELLRLPARNFLFVCTGCAFIVHGGSDESLLNQDRPAQPKPKEEIAFPDRTMPRSCQQFDAV